MSQKFDRHVGEAEREKSVHAHHLHPLIVIRVRQK